jgi:hypothetical protein
MASQDLKRENDKLRIAHGETGGKANYIWEFSENLYFPFKKEPPEWDHVANQATGLIEVKAVFEQKKMCPLLSRQWVLCRFIAPPSETHWKNTFGTKVEYPRTGYYAPTNVELDPEVAPWDTDANGASLTDMVIGMAARDRDRTVREWNEQGEEILARSERAKDAEMDRIIDDACYIPFVDNSPHIPGKRGGSVSFGGS